MAQKSESAKEKSQSPGEKFAVLLKELLEKEQMSQSALSIAAQVSLKTVNNLATNSSDNTPSRKVLTKLGTALHRDPNEFLGIFGYAQISERALSQLPQDNARAYFSSLKSSMADEKKALICITFLSKIAGSERDYIKKTLSDLVNHSNVVVALILPFSRPDEIGRSSKIMLDTYYQTIIGDVMALAKSLENACPGKENKIALFLPSARSESFFIPPYISHSLLRSVLVKLAPKNENSDSLNDYHLIAWALTRPDNERWLKIFPSAEPVNNDAAEEMLTYWISYLEEIVENFGPGNFEKVGDKTEFQTWKKFKPTLRPPQS